MKKTFARRPIGNFFILKELQLRFIRKIVYSVIISTIICLSSLLLVYFIQYRSVIFYQLNFEQDLIKENILHILGPSLLVSALVNILIGMAIGLYASRKYAVPIYKLEQWSSMLRKGNLNAKLIFREKEEMKDLSDRCNLLSDELRMKFITLKEIAVKMKSRAETHDDATAILDVIDTLQLEENQVDINTSFYSIPPDQLQNLQNSQRD